MSGALRQMYNPMQSVDLYEKTNRATSTGNALQEMMNQQTSPETRRSIPGQIANIAPDEALKLQQMSEQMDERQRQQTAQQYGELASMMQGLDDEETWNEGLKMVNAEFARQGKPAINVPFAQREGLIARVMGIKEYFEMRDKAADNRRQDMLVQSQAAQNYAQANKYKAEAAEATGGGGGTASSGGYPAPWDRVNDPKAKDRSKLAEASNYDDWRKNQRNAEAAANKMVALTQRFIRTMNNPDGSVRVRTGGFWAAPGINEVTSFLDSDWAELNAVAAEITPLMRQGLPGAASDRDVAMFERATVGTRKPNVANLRIADAAQAMAKRIQDYGSFMDAFFQMNGHLVGADTIWREYANANEIFDHDGEDLSVKKQSVPWQQWLSERMQRGGVINSGQQPQGQPQQQGQPQSQPTQMWQKGAPPGDYIAPPHLKQKYGPEVAFIRSSGNGKLILLGSDGQPLQFEQ